VVRQEEILDLVLSSLNEALAGNGVSAELVIDEATPLIGRGSVLDSLGLVQLVVEVEQRLQDHRGLSVTVADDRAMSQRNSPFRTVSSLAAYVHMLVEEQCARV